MPDNERPAIYHFPGDTKQVNKYARLYKKD